MKSLTIPSLIKFHLLLFLPLGAGFFMLALLYGCQKTSDEKKEEVKPTVSIENLQTAYNKSVKRSRMYAMFVTQAEKERLKNTAKLYEALARSEAIHAANHARLLRAQGVEPAAVQEEKVVVGTTAQTLKMAASSEELEYEAMYPNLAKTAMTENYAEAAEQFKKTLDVDTEHGQLIKDAADRGGKILTAKFLVCPDCGYILTSDKTDECPNCHAKKTTFIQI